MSLKFGAYEQTYLNVLDVGLTLQLLNIIKVWPGGLLNNE